MRLFSRQLKKFFFTNYSIQLKDKPQHHKKLSFGKLKLFQKLAVVHLFLLAAHVQTYTNFPLFFNMLWSEAQNKKIVLKVAGSIAIKIYKYCNS